MDEVLEEPDELVERCAAAELLLQPIGGGPEDLARRHCAVVQEMDLLPTSGWVNTLRPTPVTARREAVNEMWTEG
jgi:hypothetical protein